jgi:hypothetical protein
VKLRPSNPVTLVVALTALIGLGACTGQPSTKTVARDMVESLEDISETERACMMTKIDDDYTNDELDAIGEANLDFNSADPASIEGADEDMQAFVADLRSCLTG